MAFAAEYLVVALVPGFNMSLKKLISRRQFLEDKGYNEQPRRAGLAFIGNDEDSDDEDDDDNLERFISSILILTQRSGIEWYSTTSSHHETRMRVS
jgi:hypothetical protein